MIKSAAALLTLTLLAILLQAADRVRPGLWENTVTTNDKSVSKTSCRTPAEIATVNGSAKTIRESMEKGFAKTGTCMLKDLKVDGNTVSWVAACGTQSIVSRTTYIGDTSETTNTSTMGGTAKVIHIKSRRVGDCPQSVK